MSASDPHGHESAIKTPKQLITVVVLAFVVPIIAIIMLSQLVTSSVKTVTETGALTPEAIAKRIKPVAEVAVGEAGGSAGAPKSGEQIVQSVCGACHTAGVANAPKIGDNAAWGKLIKEGMKNLLATAIKGKGAMPPRGGNPDLSDFEMESAIVFMANKSGGKLKEPAPPKQAAPKPETTKPDAAAPAAPAAAKSGK